MKQVVASQVLEVPADVTIEVKARKVRVKGTRGDPLLDEILKRSSVWGHICMNSGPNDDPHALQLFYL
jgi:hypothetical protein